MAAAAGAGAGGAGAGAGRGAGRGAPAATTADVNPAYKERYTHTAVGQALLEVLNEMTRDGELPDEVAAEVLKEYFVVFDEELQKIRPSKKIGLTGTLESYTNAREEWVLRVEGVQVSRTGRRRGEEPAAVELPVMSIAGAQGAPRAKRNK